MSPPIPVLLVAHQFPPLGGPGTRRPASWVRAWPAEGIEPLVLCAPAEDGARFHGYPIVPGTEAEFVGRTIVRVPTPKPGGLARALRVIHAPPRLTWTLAYGRVREPETPWGRPAVAAGIALGRARGAMAVVSTSQPYEAHGVGRAIARTLRVPWVADFRDPMTEAESRTWPTRLHWLLERREERRLVRDADLVWATCEAAALRWRACLRPGASGVEVRRNGVGPIDVARLPRPSAAPPLRIGHIGRFTDSRARSRLAFLACRPGGRGGEGSNPEALFRGLALLLVRRPEARGRVVFMTVGSGPTAPPPAGVVAEPHPATSNAEALALAATCHALYLPLTAPNRYGPLFVQQKVYEYAALARPVLVTGTRREAVDLLGPLARLAAPDDPEALSRHVEALWDAGGTSDASRAPSIETQADVAAACANDLRRLIDGR